MIALCSPPFAPVMGSALGNKAVTPASAVGEWKLLHIKLFVYSQQI